MLIGGRGESLLGSGGRMLARNCLALAVIGAATLIGVPELRAQSAKAAPAVSATSPMFDVVSIKPNKTGSGSVDISYNDGNFDASNVSLKMLVLSAYGLKESQLLGLPKWAESDRFDIRAKVVDPDPAAMKNLTREQRRAMLQRMLTDRFGLTFHREMKMLPIYEMVQAKGGPKFKEMTAEDAASEKGVNGVRAGSMNVHNTQLTATGVPLSSLAAQLSGQLHRMVVDKTGLTGNYNLSLAWTPDDAPTTEELAAPDIFIALQEQLGLKLEPGKAEVETFVVDRAEPPSEN